MAVSVSLDAGGPPTSLVSLVSRTLICCWQVCIAAVNFVAGFLLVVGSRIMAQIPETQAAQAWLVHFFRLVPPFNLGALSTPEALTSCKCRRPV